MRAPGTRRGPAPPGAAAWRSPPSSTPANRRRTPMTTSPRGRRDIAVPTAAARPGSLLGLVQGGRGRRGMGEPFAPASARLARGRGLPGPPPLPRGPQRRTPKDGHPARARPEREPGRGAGGGRLASGLRPPPALAGRPPPAPAPDPGRASAVPPQPLILASFIGALAQPAGRGRKARGKTGRRGRGGK